MGIVYPWCNGFQPNRPEVSLTWFHIRCKFCNEDIKEKHLEAWEREDHTGQSLH